MKLNGDAMQRLYILLSVLILALFLIGCAPNAAAQPVNALENPTNLPEPAATDPIESAQAEIVADEPPTSCPITQAPEVAFVPPEPYPPEPPARYADEFWYGTPELWTMLGTGATWNGLPLDKQGYTQKIFWWSQDFNVKEDPFPAFTVILERLDVPSAPIIAAEKATNAFADFGTAMLTGVELPTLGCWKITGQYQEAELSFVVWIAP
jgi:hypothetical protein